MSHYVSIEQLLEAGAHFGHLTRRWNPKMDQFIFNEKNGIHIIDLRKTQILVDIARQAIYDISSSGRIIMFVGTKSQSRKIVEEQAIKCSQPYVTERWLGGMLTNFATIRKSIKRLNGIDKMEVDGTFEKITKKERLLLMRERDRLRMVFGGIEEMTRLPGALFVVDIKKEHIAVKEAKILGIPVIALVDTNCDPESVDFPIPCNDDSVKAVDLISTVFANSIIEGTSIANARRAELEASGERGAKESDLSDEEEPKIKRKMRARKQAGPAGKKGAKRGGRREEDKTRHFADSEQKDNTVVSDIKTEPETQADVVTTE